MGDPFADPFATRPPRWDSPGERAQWLTRVASHVDALAKLLHVARGPLPRTPVVNLVYCGRCNHGPFEGLECPECGDSDLHPWPAEAIGGKSPPRSPEDKPRRKGRRGA